MGTDPWLDSYENEFQAAELLGMSRVAGRDARGEVDVEAEAVEPLDGASADGRAVALVEVHPAEPTLFIVPGEPPPSWTAQDDSGRR